MTVPPLDEYKREVRQLLLLETDRMLYKLYPAMAVVPNYLLTRDCRGHSRCVGCGAPLDWRDPDCHNCVSRHAMRAKTVRDRVRAVVISRLAKLD